MKKNFNIQKIVQSKMYKCRCNEKSEKREREKREIFRSLESLVELFYDI